MGDIFWGAAIIGIGLFMGGSIFFGDFSLWNVLFDGLGLFFVGRGVFSLIRQHSG